MNFDRIIPGIDVSLHSIDVRHVSGGTEEDSSEMHYLAERQVNEQHTNEEKVNEEDRAYSLRDSRGEK